MMLGEQRSCDVGVYHDLGRKVVRSCDVGVCYVDRRDLVGISKLACTDKFLFRTKGTTSSSLDSSPRPTRLLLVLTLLALTLPNTVETIYCRNSLQNKSSSACFLPSLFSMQ